MLLNNRNTNNNKEECKWIEWCRDELEASPFIRAGILRPFMAPRVKTPRPFSSSPSRFYIFYSYIYSTELHIQLGFCFIIRSRPKKKQIIFL